MMLYSRLFFYEANRETVRCLKNKDDVLNFDTHNIQYDFAFSGRLF